MHKVSDKLVEFLKDYESFRDKPYKDGGEYWTIGYGHLMTEEEIKEVKSVTEDEATELFKLDLQEAQSVVNDMVKVDLLQHQYDALVSFAYNVGGERFHGSTLLKLLNKGFYGTVDEQLAKWIKSKGKVQGGLVKRRGDEGRMFNEGVYERS
jgi:lysozyme